MIALNLAAIKARIEHAATRVGRNASDVRIVAAAKGQGARTIEEAIAAGITIIGHNYVQEAQREKPGLTVDRVEFHMIGRLQANKVGKALELFDVIQTVDGAGLAKTLHRRAEAVGRVVGVMIQVNSAREPQKSGIEEDAVERLVHEIRELPALRLRGLMTMPPFFDEPERARPYFSRLRDLRDRLVAAGALAPDMKELSMGMTGDFDAAVEEGATLVRIGTALFGPRG
jgi:PLP dependent protein